MKVQRADKPWGYELLLARTERYAGKLLCIQAGQRLSLQHHTVKDETLILLEGETELEIDTGRRTRRRMAKDRSYRVQAGRKHRLTALTDARVLEVSTPEIEDVVRWEDDYGRVPAPGPLHQLPSGRGSSVREQDRPPIHSSDLGPGGSK